MTQQNAFTKHLLSDSLASEETGGFSEGVMNRRGAVEVTNPTDPGVFIVDQQTDAQSCWPC